MAEKFGFEHSDDEIEAKKVEAETTKDDLYRAQSDLPHVKEQLKEISEGAEKIKVVPMYTYGSEQTIGDSFETEAYVIRQEVNGKDRVFIGHDKLHAKRMENWGASTDAQNSDLGISDRFEIGGDGKITMYATNPEKWNPPATWKAKDKILKADDKIVSLKNKIMGTDTESRLKKDLSGHDTGHAEIGEMKNQRDKR